MYVNTLISLQENGATYGIDGQKVSGHVTLSSPGVIKCYVQNLKPQPLGQSFTLCVFSKSRQEGAKVGQLGTGKETRWLLDERNIGGSGLKLEEIDAVAIVAENTMRGTEAILVGYSRERYMIMSIIDSLFPKETFTSSYSIPVKPVQQEVSTSKVTRPEISQVKEVKPELLQAKEPDVKGSQVKEPKPELLQAKEPELKGSQVKEVKPELLQAKEPELKVSQVKELRPELLQAKEPNLEESQVKEPESDISQLELREPEISQPNEDIILPKDAISYKIAALYEAVKAAEGKRKEEAPQIDRAKVKDSEAVAKSQAVTAGTNNDTLESELKRIIEELSRDQVLKEKALNIEEQISKISDRPEMHKLIDKSHLEKTLEARYLSKQGQIQSVLGEEEEVVEEEEDIDTNPKEAIKSFNTLKQKEQDDTSTLENTEEEDTTSANQEEVNYLEEIDKKLQEIRSRLETSYQEER